MGVSVSSVIRYTRRSASALCAHITTYIKWPTEEKKIGIKARLGGGNLRDVIGSVDGTMIEVYQAPTGVCDNRAVFTFFTTGYTGSRHDSSAYMDTPCTGKVQVLLQRRPFGSRRRLRLDPKPYHRLQRKKPTPGERHIQRSSRVRIEHAFGGLKVFARCLNKLRLDHTGENDMRRLNQHIMAYVVLYNLLLIEDIPDNDPDPDITFSA